MRVAACAAALVVFVLASATGRAEAQDPFEAAERARAEGELEAAERGYQGALESGALGLSEVAHAHLRLAEIAYLGEELEAGERHLRFALALRADAPVEEDAPQAMRDAAAAILVERSQRTLRAVLEISDATAPIRVDVRDAPDGLVRTVSVAGPGGFARTMAWEGEARELAVPPEHRPIGVRLLDRHGNALGAAGEWPAPPRVVAIEPTAVPDPAVVAAGADPPSEAPAEAPAETPEGEGEGDGDDPEVFENPWFWVAIGVVVVIAALAIGFTATGETYSLAPPVAPGAM